MLYSTKKLDIIQPKWHVCQNKDKCDILVCAHRKPHLWTQECQVHMVDRMNGKLQSRSRPMKWMELCHMYGPMRARRMRSQERMKAVHVKCSCMGLPTRPIPRHGRIPKEEMLVVCPGAEPRCANVCSHGLVHKHNKWCNGMFAEEGEYNFQCRPPEIIRDDTSRELLVFIENERDHGCFNDGRTRESYCNHRDVGEPEVNGSQDGGGTGTQGQDEYGLPLPESWCPEE